MSTRKRSEDDFAREIRSHLELEAERLVEEGVPSADAGAAARRAFGNVTAARERFYERGRLLWLDHLRQDVRCAIRNMRRSAVASIVAIASLAAGLGATTVTLTLRDAVFYKPPPLYRDPAQLSRIQVGPADRRIGRLGSPVPAPLYLVWIETLPGAIAGAADARIRRDVRIGDRTDTVSVRAVTPEFFNVLGVPPHLGHAGFPDLAGGDSRSVVLAYRLWQRLFDGRPDVLGRVLWIDNDAYTVTGVMPERFWFGDMDSPLWMALDPRTLGADDRLEVVVRRPAGTTARMLETQLLAGFDQYRHRVSADQRNVRMVVRGVEGTPIGWQVALILPYLLGAAVVLTLLIACANVAILMIAQWTAREHEIAIRASIGASRRRIIRSLLTESVLIALFGGALGVAVTFALRAWVVQRAGAAAFFDLSIDTSILVETAIVAFAVGIVVGIAPAIYETRRLHVNPLRTLATSDRARQRWRSALVVFEITMTMALLVETTAMIDGYLRARSADMGYDTAPLLSARIDNPVGVPISELLDVVKGVPGVSSAAAVTTVPYFRAPRVRVAADPTGANAIVSDRVTATSDFFPTLGVRLRAGRPFAERESTRVAIVNDCLARRLFGSGGALGARIWIGHEGFELVGVVEDYSNDPLQPVQSQPKMFVPLAPDRTKEVTAVHILIRAKGDPAPLAHTLRQAVRDRLPGSAMVTAYTAREILTVVSQEYLVGTAPLFPLIVISILLTTSGIYGVLAFAIAHRSRELAVRMAIGATGTDLIKLVTSQTIRLVAVGAGAGVAATFALSRIVRAGGGAGTIWDPGLNAFIVPVLIVLVIGALATWIPARRALRINPSDLLRTT